MKKITSILTAVLLLFTILIVDYAKAQAPQKFSYQAVIRDGSNNLVTNSNIGMQISINQGSPGGTSVYVETQTPVTNENGLISVNIGNGTIVSGDFTGIDWGSGPYFIKSEIDPAGGASYSITNTQELMSVPYALHAGNTLWEKDNEFENGVNLIGDSTRVEIGSTIQNSTEAGRLYFREGHNSIVDFAGIEFAYNGDVNKMHVLNGWGAITDIDTVVTIDRASGVIKGQIGIGTTDPDDDVRLHAVGGTKIGANGVNVQEIIEITGTTDASGSQDMISFPPGYDKTNCRVLSAEIEMTGSSWRSIGYYHSLTQQSIYTSLSSSVFLYYPDDASFQSQKYRITLMKVQ